MIIFSKKILEKKDEEGWKKKGKEEEKRERERERERGRRRRIRKSERSESIKRDYKKTDISARVLSL